MPNRDGGGLSLLGSLGSCRSRKSLEWLLYAIEVVGTRGDGTLWLTVAGYGWRALLLTMPSYCGLTVAEADLACGTRLMARISPVSVTQVPELENPPTSIEVSVPRTPETDIVCRSRVPNLVQRVVARLVKITLRITREQKQGGSGDAQSPPPLRTKEQRTGTSNSKNKLKNPCPSLSVSSHLQPHNGACRPKPFGLPTYGPNQRGIPFWPTNSLELAVASPQGHGPKPCKASRRRASPKRRVRSHEAMNPDVAPRLSSTLSCGSSSVVYHDAPEVTVLISRIEKCIAQSVHNVAGQPQPRVSPSLCSSRSSSCSSRCSSTRSCTSVSGSHSSCYNSSDDGELLSTPRVPSVP